MAGAPDPQHVTQWLTAWRHGDERARDQLFAAVYPQLRQIASRFMQHERGDHTLEPTALVNELTLRLLGSEPIAYSDRTHFFALAAQMMRRILIDHARARVAEKRGGVQQRVNLSSVEDWQPGPQSEDVVMLDRRYRSSNRRTAGQRRSWSCASLAAYANRRLPTCSACR